MKKKKPAWSSLNDNNVPQTNTVDIVHEGFGCAKIYRNVPITLELRFQSPIFCTLRFVVLCWPWLRKLWEQFHGSY